MHLDQEMNGECFRRERHRGARTWRGIHGFIVNTALREPRDAELAPYNVRIGLQNDNQTAGRVAYDFSRAVRESVTFSWRLSHIHCCIIFQSLCIHCRMALCRSMTVWCRRSRRGRRVKGHPVCSADAGQRRNFGLLRLNGLRLLVERLQASGHVTRRQQGTVPRYCNNNERRKSVSGVSLPCFIVRLWFGEFISSVRMAAEFGARDPPTDKNGGHFQNGGSPPASRDRAIDKSTVICGGIDQCRLSSLWWRYGRCVLQPQMSSYVNGGHNDEGCGL